MNIQEVLVAGAIMVVVHQVAPKEQAVQQRIQARQQTQIQRQIQARQVLPQRQPSQITQEQINRLTVQQTIVVASLALVLGVARAVVHHHHREAL